MKSFNTPPSAHPAQTRQPFILELKGPCNNNCIFCRVSLSKTHEDYDRIRGEITAAGQKGASEIVFTGAEPTLHPQLARLVRDAREAGFRRIRIETNGRAFAYEKYTQSIFDSKPSEIAILFPECRKNAFDDLVRAPGAFAQLTAALKNLRRIKSNRLKLIAKIPLIPENALNISDILVKAHELGFDAADIDENAAEGRLSVKDIEKAAASAKHTAHRTGLRLEIHGRGGLTNIPGRADTQKEIRRQMFDLSYMYLPAGRVFLGATLHVTFRCNMKCPFCTAPPLSTDVPASEVRKAIRLSIEREYPRIVFTGGEPTVRKELLSFVDQAREGGIPEVSLFTNGLLLSDRAKCRELADAGLNSALVSLHAHREDINTHITGIPGAFDKTRRAALNLLDSGVATVLSFVVNSQNYEFMDAYVDFVHRELHGIPIDFSYTTLLQEDSPASDMLPCFTSAAPRIIRALDKCDALGIPCCGLEPHWGVPPCVLNADERYFPYLLPFRQAAIPPDFVKPTACAECAVDDRCFGVRKSYAKIYGLEELRPVRRPS